MKPHWKFLFLIVACSAFALLGALQVQYLVWEGSLRFTVAPPNFWSLLFPRLLYWYVIGALIPLLYWIVGRRSFLQWSGRALALHVLVALGFIVAVPILDRSLEYVFERAVLGTASATFRPRIFQQAETRLLQYGMILASILSWFHYRSSEEQKRQARDLEIRNSELEADLAKAELETLRMQINPHFVFNSLNSVSSLTETDAPLARTMISRIGDFLRATLARKGTPMVSLEEELDVLDRYLSIETLRFGDRLQVELDIAPSTTQARIPYLLLQPLVENAIKHGLENGDSKGLLRIRAFRDRNQLRIEIVNSGKGPGTGRGAVGLGLPNTHARLERLYGDSYRLELRPFEAGGMSVRLSIPLNRQTDE